MNVPVEQYAIIQLEMARMLLERAIAIGSPELFKAAREMERDAQSLMKTLPARKKPKKVKTMGKKGKGGRKKGC